MEQTTTLPKRIMTRSLRQKVDSGEAKVNSWFGDAPLTEREEKYCRCVLKVGDKAEPECLKQRKWFQKVDGKQCYNPYAVCAKSTKGSNRKCGPSYDFASIDDEYLRAYAYLNNISVPLPYNRQNMLNNISSWKGEKGYTN